MKSGKRIALGAVILIAALLVVPFVLPLGYLVPEIERIASEHLKAQVRVDSLRLFFLPLPHVTVSGIVVGKMPFLQVRELVVTPRVMSLFSSPRVISEISLHGVFIGQALFAKASRWAEGSAGSGPAAVRVERVKVQDAFLDLPGFKLQNVDLDLELTPEGRLAWAQVHADNDHMSAILVPRGKNFTVKIVASDWKLPAGPQLLMSSLTATGVLDPEQGLTLPAIEARVYDGRVTGKLNVGWDKEWTIAGKLDIHDVEIQPVVALFTKGTTISGRLTANPVVDMRAPSAALLADAVDVESDFKVQKGILYNVDLGNVQKVLVNKDVLNGGQTQFDEFSGHLGVDSAGYYLTNVEISSGVLSAKAELSISSKQELSGQVDVAIKGTSGFMSTPLLLSGTVQNPSLNVSKATFAGAAAGTALLGPGLGTTVGMEVGRFTQKLFGKKPAKKTQRTNSETRKQPAEAASADPTKSQPLVHTGR
jgi:hypothetical protein